LEEPVTSQDHLDWFVVRTKPHKELLAHNELCRQAVATFLPLLKAPFQVYGRLAWVRAPLFPCYLFARFPGDATFKVRNTRGVREIVSFDNEPSAVPESVIDELKGRCVDGVVELPSQRFQPNQPVKVTRGAFRGWDAIFERYLRSDERVAVLLRTVETTGLRVVLPAWKIVKG
jgi:transcriptional antiterminator RfaH